MVSFLDKHKLLSTHQFGFRHGKSTVDAIVSLVDMIVDGIESRRPTVATFLDLSKAFDCVDHNILLQILESLGIRGVPLLWIKSFLSDRTQAVQIEDQLSEYETLDYGVPQGANLSPLFFLIYVDNIASSLRHGHIVQYADDTTLCFSAESKAILEIQTYVDLNSCIQTFNEINLTTNPSKSKFIRFRLRENNLNSGISVMVEDNPLEEVDATKFLGIYLDQGLTWNPHIESVCKKLSSGIHALRTLSKCCPLQVLLSAYFGLIYPHLSYGIVLWGGCARTEFNRVFRLQKKSIRVMLKLGNRESCVDAFKLLGLLTLPCLYILETTMHCLSRDSLVQGRDVHEHDTRGRDSYRTVQHRTVARERLPSQAGVAFLNHLPDSIKGQTVKKHLKTKLKRLLVERTFYSVDEFMTCRWEETMPR